ncbi:uncharacterized protein LOC131302967 [Rhododendron vialii]|uniref:uncharacterized protein LOC131302967 n=1 Tax=Rhododendron vialii TaxID=182163 RepID=UPI00265DEF47|nr:uncharacterized protein LOC131302967 [Rhododendron vialii]
MVVAARRIRPYFQAHSIKVLIDQPLRRVLHCPETSGRLIQWSIELGKFDIEYKPRIAIKAQVLADFLVEYTYPKPEELPKEEPKPWILQVDKSTTREACRASLILTSPKAKSDSQLVVGQVLGEYTMKEEVMQKYLSKVKPQVAKLKSLNVVRIPREENIEVDYLAKLATAKEDMPFHRMHQYGPIVDYITNGTLPDDKVKARQLKIRAAKYLMMGDVLYMRSFSLPYLRCLTMAKSAQAMEEVHQGCQRFANIIHGSPTVLSPMKGPWPFTQWGVDLIGPLPMAAGQVQHAIIAVDYFTKWVEAKALATITAEVIIDFLWKFIISHFGLPRVIVTDRGKQFDNTQFKAYCISKGIHVHYASKAHPKANGQITPRTATGETPYSFAFGAEAVVPIEIELFNYRTASTDHQENQEDLRAELDLLEETRETAMAKVAMYQQRMVKYHDAQVRPRDFRASDLVLRKVDPTGKKVGKLGPN